MNTPNVMGRALSRWRLLAAVVTIVFALWTLLLFSVGDSRGDPDPAPLQVLNGGTSNVISMAPRPEPHSPPSPWRNASHLIIVAGHTVYMGQDYASASAENEKNWFLFDYQRGQLGWFLDHIKRGVQAALADPKSLLIFSGGASRLNAGPRTEGLSYWLFADAHQWYSASEEAAGEVRRRTFTEEFARDSYENLIYSVCRFRQISGVYPSHITMVSLPFKERRFRDIHLRAMRYPPARFTYLGVGGSSQAAEQGEAANSVEPYAKDPYGCKGSLAQKRLQRDPFRRDQPYPKGCPELAGLLSSCSSSIFDGPLPWDHWKV